MQEIMNNMYIKVRFREKKKMAGVKIFVSFLYKRKYEWIFSSLNLRNANCMSL